MHLTLEGSSLACSNCRLTLYAQLQQEDAVAVCGTVSGILYCVYMVCIIYVDGSPPTV